MRAKARSVSGFDYVAKNDRMGQRSWELAESELQKTAIRLALRKATLPERSLDLILAGDLLNQCIGSFLASMHANVPYLGQYGACSTMAQGLALGGCLVESGAADRLLAAASSHFCSAERQYRFPLAYGGQRTSNRTMDDYCGRRGYSRQCAGAERRGAVRCARDACSVRQNGRNGRQGRGQHGCGDGARRCKFRPIHFSVR